MSKRHRRQSILIVLLALSGLLIGIASYKPSKANLVEPQPQGEVEVVTASKVTTSTQPLSGLAPAPVSLGAHRQAKPIRLNPNVLVSLGPAPKDPILQTTVRTVRSPRTARGTSSATPLAAAPIEGLGADFENGANKFSVEVAPPDTSGAVGDTQFVQWVNTSFAVFDKRTRKPILGPVMGNLLFAPLGGNCATDNDGDPIVQYDKIARRWVLSQFAVSSGFSQCVAISTTSDATGTYHLYEFTYPAFDDYPKVGVWPDGYYVTFNMFGANDKFLGTRVCAYDRRKMLQGLPAKQQCVQLGSTVFGIMPADLDGASTALADASGNATGPAAPPAGSPNYIIGLGDDSRSLNLWKFHVDWNTPANSTLGIGPSHRPDTKILVARFTLACNGSGETCVTQPGASNPEKLDTLGERVMFRLAYRRFSNHEALVVNHSVDTGAPNPRTGVRWYEIRNPNSPSPTVFQQSTFAPSTAHRWMGSIAMDKVGNLAVGYSISSTTIFPGLRYATRDASDPPSTLAAESHLQDGTGTQRCKLTNGNCECIKEGTSGPVLDSRGNPVCDKVSRWGDYSGMTVDPTDDCTFWFTSEYQKKTGGYKWHTKIGSFKLPGCR